MFSIQRQFALVLSIFAALTLPAKAVPVSGTSTFGVVSSTGTPTFAPFYFRTQFQYDTNGFTKVDQGTFVRYSYLLNSISLSTAVYNNVAGSPLPLDSDFLAIPGTGTGTVTIDRLFNTVGGPNTDKLKLNIQYQNATVSPGHALTSESVTASTFFNPVPGSNSSLFTVDASGNATINWDMISPSIVPFPEVTFASGFDRGFVNKALFTGPTTVANVPIPGTLLLFLSGGAMLFGIRRHR
jgi:hypothetical protein